MLSLISFLLVTIVFSHPHKHDYTMNTSYLTPEQLLNGELPIFRSFHAHVLFNNRRSDDTCNGIDNALELQQKYKKYFNISEDQPECQADFDLGNDICMFPVALGPFGPFPVPETASYVPFHRFAEVVQFYMQNRGMLSVFVHPNSGYERNDHGHWGLWIGTPTTLDLSDYEFSPQLPQLYNTSCRDQPAIFPEPTGPPALLSTNAHVRVLSFQKDSTPITVTVTGALAGFLPVMNTQQTWYQDVIPGSVSICTSANNCLTEALTAGQFYTALYFEGQLNFVVDNNNVADNGAFVRIVNLIQSSPLITVTRNNVSIGSIKFFQIDNYFVDQPTPNTQNLYQFYDAITNELIVTEPYYVNAGEVETIWLYDISSRQNGNASAILSFDYPHDSPFGH